MLAKCIKLFSLSYIWYISGLASFFNKNTVSLLASLLATDSINLLSLIRENYSQTDAGELERRFLNSIRGSDANKFTRGIRKMRDNKK